MLRQNQNFLVTNLDMLGHGLRATCPLALACEGRKAADFDNCVLSACQQSSVQVGCFSKDIGPEAAGCMSAVTARTSLRAQNPT